MIVGSIPSPAFLGGVILRLAYKVVCVMNDCSGHWRYCGQKPVRLKNSSAYKTADVASVTWNDLEGLNCRLLKARQDSLSYVSYVSHVSHVSYVSCLSSSDWPVCPRVVFQGTIGNNIARLAVRR